MQKKGCLIIHGFGGDLREIQYLADYLQHRNIDVHTALLAGHGRTKAYLKKSSWHDWIFSVKAKLLQLDHEYDHISIVGFSMGGLLAMQLIDEAIVEEVVLVNTPVFFWNIRIIARDIVNSILNPQKHQWSYYANSISKVSIKSCIDFLQLLLISVKQLPPSEKPVLILQCTEDESVYYKSGRFLQKKLGKKADLKYYSGGCHQVFSVKKLKDIVCKDIYTFLAN